MNIKKPHEVFLACLIVFSMITAIFVINQNDYNKRFALFESRLEQMTDVDFLLTELEQFNTHPRYNPIKSELGKAKHKKFQWNTLYFRYVQEITLDAIKEQKLKEIADRASYYVEDKDTLYLIENLLSEVNKNGLE